MSLEINAYSTYAAATKSSKSTATQETTTSESKPYSNVSEYKQYLSEKFAFFGKQSSVYGVPTTVTVSEDFLQKCVDDPEKAAWLESNLASFAESTKWANNYLKSCPGSPQREFQALSIDGNGNMSMTSRSSNRASSQSNNRIAQENAAKKIREKKANEAKLEKKRAEKKKAEERLAKLRAERKEQREQLAELREKRKEQKETLQTHDVTVMGRDMWNVTEKTVEAISRAVASPTAASGTIALDIKV